MLMMMFRFWFTLLVVVVVEQALADYQAPEYKSVNGILNVTIEVDWLWTLNGTRYAPAYNGGIVGPTLRVSPGDTMYVHLVNKLEPETPLARELLAYLNDPTNDRVNATIIENRLSNEGDVTGSAYGYWGQNYMNLHFHGARNDPKVEDVRSVLDGGEERTYVYHFDSDQPPGLAWYHSHVHGTTTYSYFAGLAGAVVIEGTAQDLTTVPEIAAAKEVILIVSESRVNATTGRPFDFFIPVLDFAWVGTTNGQAGADTVVTFKAGEMGFFRMISSTVEANLDFSIDGHTLLPVAYDGYPIQSSPLLPESVLTIDTGGRVEFLVRFDTPGNYTFRGHPWNGGVSGIDACQAVFGIPVEACHSFDRERIIATIVVTENTDTGSPTTTASYPTTLPDLAPQLTDMASRPAVRERSVAMTVNLGDSPFDNLPFTPSVGFGMNNNYFDRFLSAGEIELGTCETWTIVSNAPVAEHPFHIHSVPFLITHENGIAVDQPYWRDTLAVTKSNYTAHVCFLKHTGQILVHCHMAVHLDLGMAANYFVVDSISSAPSSAVEDAPVTPSPVTPAPVTAAPIAPPPPLPTMQPTPNPTTARRTRYPTRRF